MTGVHVSRIGPTKVFGLETPAMTRTIASWCVLPPKCMKPASVGQSKFLTSHPFLTLPTLLFAEVRRTGNAPIVLMKRSLQVEILTHIWRCIVEYANPNATKHPIRYAMDSHL